ncbi:MAG: phosphatidylglycerophosphatase A [Gammaproteobacteria bacterium]
MQNKVILFIAQGFGSGRLPKMPGTWGTLVGIPIYLLMHDLPIATYLAITFLFTVFGCWLCGVASKQLGTHDHSSIVWDEIVGFLWTMAAVPFGWGWILAGFLLFRLFDIWKPWPVSWADQRIKGGTGVMVDDLIAALFAWVILQIAAFYLR